MTYPAIGPAGSLPGSLLADGLVRAGPGLLERVAELRNSVLWTRRWRGRAAESFAARVCRPRGLGRLADEFGSGAMDICRAASCPGWNPLVDRREAW